MVGFVVATGAAAAAPTYTLFALSLVPVGLSALTALTTANAMVGLRVEPYMRGRVMALYMAIFMGGTPVGAPIIVVGRRRPGGPLDHRDRHGRRGARLGRCVGLARPARECAGELPSVPPRFQVSTVPLSEAVPEAAR